MVNEMLSKIFIYILFSSSLTVLFYLFYLLAERVFIRKTDIELKYHILRSILLVQPVFIGIYYIIRQGHKFTVQDVGSNAFIQDTKFASSEWMPAIPEQINIPVCLNQSRSLFDDYLPLVIKYAAMIWAAAAAVLLVRKVFLYISFRKKLTEKTEYIRQEGRVKILAVGQNVIPFLTGVIDPVIVVPLHCMETYELNMVIKHEMAHFKNNDHLLRIYGDLLTCINWFNPVLRKITDNLNKESEILADAAVIASATEKIRLEYGNLLIHFAGMISERNSSIVGFSSQKDRLKERLEYISMKRRKRTGIAAIILVCTVIIVLACGCASVSKSAIDVVAGISASGKEESVAEPLQNESDTLLNVSDVSEDENIKPESHLVFEDEHTLVFDGPLTEYDEEYADKWRGEHLVGPRTMADDPQPVPELSIVDGQLQEIIKTINEVGKYRRTAENGENLYSICNGTVLSAKYESPWGLSIVIEDENGNKWRYSYCDKLIANKGDHVNYGDLIALAGSTGMTPEDTVLIKPAE